MVLPLGPDKMVMWARFGPRALSLTCHIDHHYVKYCSVCLCVCVFYPVAVYLTKFCTFTFKHVLIKVWAKF